MGSCLRCGRDLSAFVPIGVDFCPLCLYRRTRLIETFKKKGLPEQDADFFLINVTDEGIALESIRLYSKIPEQNLNELLAALKIGKIQKEGVPMVFVSSKEAYRLFLFLQNMKHWIPLLDHCVKKRLDYRKCKTIALEQYPEGVLQLESMTLVNAGYYADIVRCLREDEGEVARQFILPEDELFILGHADGCSCAEIAEHLQVTQMSVFVATLRGTIAVLPAHRSEPRLIGQEEIYRVIVEVRADRGRFFL